MTRINSAIPVNALTDEHLLAEHREIKRLPSVYRKSITSGSINKIPKEFCLGTGHVTFFLDKQGFIYNRYQDIHRECRLRGFNVKDYSGSWRDGIRKQDWNSYTPTSTERDLLINRICDRIQSSSKVFFHYKGKCISKQEAMAKIRNTKFSNNE